MFRLALLAVVLAVLAGNYRSLLRLKDLPLPFPADTETVQPLPDNWSFQHDPAEGRFAPTANLTSLAARLYGVSGCETVAPAPDGTVTLIDKWNNVYQAFETNNDPPNSDEHAAKGWSVRRHPLIQNVGTGRALGAVYGSDGNLYFADAVKGLCMVNFSAPHPPRVEILASRLPKGLAASQKQHEAIAFADDLDIHPNGTIFFSDASSIAPLAREPDSSFDVEQGSLMEACRAVPSGRLLAYHPSTGAITVALSNLWFANGVAVSADGSFVLVSETFGMRVLRYWLTGPKAGQSEVFIDRLPGFPDGVSRAADGGFWVALVSPYQLSLDRFGYRMMRFVMAWMPASLKPKFKSWGYALKLGADGKVVAVAADLEGKVVRGFTASVEGAGKLWFGNLHHGHVGMVDLSAV